MEDSEYESKGQPPEFVSDRNFEIVGERVNQLSASGARRHSNYPSTKSKLAISSSYMQNRNGPVLVAANNSSRVTTSQAQALQRLKETKVPKVKSPTEPRPLRKVANYVRLAQEEGGISSSTA